LTNISENLDSLGMEVTIDTSLVNPIYIKVCFKTDCSLKSSKDEGFKLYLTDKACPRPKLDSLYVPLELIALDYNEPLKDIPNVFTPNNDGINDYFSIDNGFAKPCIDDFSIVIFNRWGHKLFESKDFSFRWSGDNLPTGVYFYMIKFGEKEKAGSILLKF
jgi:gliding motility-associated-like protein